MTDESEPVESMEVGEVEEISVVQSYSFWGSAMSEFVGFDREIEEISIEDAEVVGEGGDMEVRLGWTATIRKVERDDEDAPDPSPLSDASTLSGKIEQLLLGWEYGPYLLFAWGLLTIPVFAVVGYYHGTSMAMNVSSGMIVIFILWMLAGAAGGWLPRRI